MTQTEQVEYIRWWLERLYTLDLQPKRLTLLSDSHQFTSAATVYSNLEPYHLFYQVFKFYIYILALY